MNAPVPGRPVVAAFEDRSAVERAVDRLTTDGVEVSAISVLMCARTRAREWGVQVGGNAEPHPDLVSGAGVPGAAIDGVVRGMVRIHSGGAPGCRVLAGGPVISAFVAAVGRGETLARGLSLFGVGERRRWVVDALAAGKVVLCVRGVGDGRARLAPLLAGVGRRHRRRGG